MKNGGLTNTKKADVSMRTETLGAILGAPLMTGSGVVLEILST